MSSELPEKKRKLPVLRLVIAAVLGIVVALILLRGIEPRVVIDRGMAAIREAGPWVFFAAMTVLPAVGMPLSIFTISAGEAFGATLGIGAVIAISLVVIAVNLALGYWVARYALRP